MNELHPIVIEDSDLKVFLQKLKQKLNDLEMSDFEVRSISYSSDSQKYSTLIVVVM